MEAIVAGGFAVGLLMPQLQAIGQGFPLVGAGKVNDQGGAAPQRRSGARGKVIGRGGIADIQVKMGVGVDEAGEQQLSRHIHHLCLRAGQILPQLDDGLAVHQHIHGRSAGAGNHPAALEQQFHEDPPLCVFLYCITARCGRVEETREKSIDKRRDSATILRKRGE